jgi:hypothetical protein
MGHPASDHLQPPGISLPHDILVNEQRNVVLLAIGKTDAYGGRTDWAPAVFRELQGDVVSGIEVAAEGGQLGNRSAEAACVPHGRGYLASEIPPILYCIAAQDGIANLERHASRGVSRRKHELQLSGEIAILRYQAQLPILLQRPRVVAKHAGVCLRR